MEIYIINPYRQTEPHFPIVGMIPSYYSYLWNVQLYGLGYFELTVAATMENVKQLKEGRFLVRQCDIKKNNPSDEYPEYKNAMIIRTVNITYDADHGFLLNVTGKSVKDALSQRIIWEPFECVSSAIGWVIQNLIQRNASDPTNYSGNELRYASQHLTGCENAERAAHTAYQDAAGAYHDAVIEYGEDSPEAQEAEAVMNSAKEYWDQTKVELAEAQKEYNYYVWFDEVSAKREIPYLTADVMYPPSDIQVTLQLYGENLGEWCETICTEYGIGWNLYLNETGLTFEFIEGTDKSSTVIFSPELDNLKNATYSSDLLIYKNAALATGEGEGYDQVVVDVGSASGYSRYETFISTGLIKTEEVTDEQYKSQVRQYGKSEIARLQKREVISGEIDTEGVFKIDEDFKLGDVVKVKLDQGIEATTRLTEIIYSDETSGKITTGTFEEWEVA